MGRFRREGSGDLCQGLAAIACVAILAAFTAAAQSSPGILDTWKENAAALRQYRYKRRTQILLQGAPHSAAVVDVRYVDGKVEAVPVEAPAMNARAMAPPLAPQEEGDLERYIEKLGALMLRYLPPESGLPPFFAKSVVSPAGAGPKADLRISAMDLAVPSDTVTFIWSRERRQAVRLEIESVLDKKPVSGTVEYAVLPGGPFYPAKTVLSAPSLNLQIVIETFDYTK